MGKWHRIGRSARNLLTRLGRLAWQRPRPFGRGLARLPQSLRRPFGRDQISEKVSASSSSKRLA